MAADQRLSTQMIGYAALLGTLVVGAGGFVSGPLTTIPLTSSLNSGSIRQNARAPFTLAAESAGPSANTAKKASDKELSTNTSIRRRIAVVGGSGRVGGSAVRAIHKFGGNSFDLVVVGRQEKNFQRSRKRWEEIDKADYTNVNFITADLLDHKSIEAAIRGCDLVINTAGPFQRKKHPEVLAAAIEAGVSYVDVMDDARLAKEAKSMSARAKEKGVSAVISTGIWPGVDSLMAAEACDLLGGPEQVQSIDFSAYTAGTGNAGPTILSATFLILREKVLGYLNDREILYEPASDFKTVDFGFANKTVFRMNLIEAFTCRETLRVPRIDTYFGTAPEPWNYLLAAMAKLPQSILGNRDLMQALAVFSEPVVRVTDRLVGATNAMKITAVGKDEGVATLRYAHKDLEECVGIATAAFANATLRGDVSPGVWFPEEAFSDRAARQRLFEEATQGAFLWDVSVTSRGGAN